MQDIFLSKNNNIYIFFLKYKKIFLYFKDKENVKEILITEDCFSNFDVTCDKNGNFNIIYFNDKREIVHITNKNNSWVKKTIYKYEEKIYIDNLKLLICDDIYHLMFTIKNLEKPDEIILSYMKWDKIWYGSKIDTIKYNSSSQPYSVSLDIEGNLHLIYVTEEINHKLYYTFYNNNFWSQKSLIAESKYILFQDIINDKNKNSHIIWLEDNSTKEIKYRKKTNGGWPKGSWNNTISLVYLEDTDSPIITLINNTLWCTYNKNKNIYSLISNDFGTSWSRPFKVLEISETNYKVNKFSDFDKKIISNYCYSDNQKNYVLLQTKNNMFNKLDKNSYFTFYISEVQEYLKILSEKLDIAIQEKNKLKEELDKKNNEILIKKRNIEDLQGIIKRLEEDKNKIFQKADSYSVLFNTLLIENQNLRKQIIDLENQVFILKSQANEIRNIKTIDKIKSIFYKKS
ncbi:MAG: coiled-coil domain-containing protein [Thermoanaerobacteraceae bacterium]